jgi:hypothetical protein
MLAIKVVHQKRHKGHELYLTIMVLLKNCILVIGMLHIKGREIQIKRHNHHCMLRKIDQLSGVDFWKIFRMSRSSFDKIYTTTEPLLFTPNTSMARQSLGSSISKKALLYLEVGS